MNTTIILHTEKEDSLRIILSELVSKYDKTQVSLRLNCKSYIPWEKEDIKNVIITFGQYIANPTNLNQIESTIQLIYASTTDKVVVVDEENIESISISFDRRQLLFLNLDRKYHTLSWFMTDIYTQYGVDQKYVLDHSDDCDRFLKKVRSPLYKEKIIYIDGGIGDHVMSLPFVEKVSSYCFICCKYPFVFEHINKKGYIGWNDDLFGGQSCSVYHYASYINYSKTIVDAFFEMHGFERSNTDILKYNGNRVENLEYKDIERIALICTSAAKVNGLDSNKDWPEIRWMKIVNEMKLLGYHVIQVGTETDNQIPNVDSKFLDKPLEKLASLIEQAKIWISVDTFFHHFAASINPTVGICLTPFYNDHAKHPGVKYIEKDCGKDFSSRKFWLDLQQPERKECMMLITVDDVLNELHIRSRSQKKSFVEFVIPTFDRIDSLRSILSSLLCQTDSDWSAHVIIDDTENKEVMNLVKSMNSDKIYCSTLNKRYNDHGHTPRNYGKNKSTADYIIMTGDDNYYVPTFVSELKKATINNPMIVYWDMVHSYPDYNTKIDYQLWKSILVCNFIDIGAFAIRNDIAKKFDLCDSYWADGILVENILTTLCDDYPLYKKSIMENSLETPLDGVSKINKILFVHN